MRNKIKSTLLRSTFLLLIPVFLVGVNSRLICDLEHIIVPSHSHENTHEENHNHGHSHNEVQENSENISHAHESSEVKNFPEISSAEAGHGCCSSIGTPSLISQSNQSISTNLKFVSTNRIDFQKILNQYVSIKSKQYKVLLATSPPQLLHTSTTVLTI